MADARAARAGRATATGRRWGEWGGADEVGALNRLAPEHLVAAARLVREGRVISLGLAIDDRADRPRLPQRAAPKHLMASDGGDFLAGRMREGEAFISEDYLFLCVHEGTHLDALSHVGAQGHIYNGFPAQTLTSAGAQHCGMERVPGIVGRGVLLDPLALVGGRCLEPGFPISSAVLRRCCDRQGVEILPGDTVYIRTGWMKNHDQGGWALEVGEPGLDLDGGVHLADMGVVAIGMDNFGIEPYPLNSHRTPRPIPVHVEMLRNRGVYLLEFCDLDELAGSRRSTFLSIIAPLRITGGVGSPVNPLAVL